MKVQIGKQEVTLALPPLKTQYLVRFGMNADNELIARMACLGVCWSDHMTRPARNVDFKNTARFGEAVLDELMERPEVTGEQLSSAGLKATMMIFRPEQTGAEGAMEDADFSEAQDGTSGTS